MLQSIYTFIAVLLQYWDIRSQHVTIRFPELLHEKDGKAELMLFEYFNTKIQKPMIFWFQFPRIQTLKGPKGTKT